MTMKYESILDTVGKTPIVRLSKLAPMGVKLYGKLESFNPMGSVKDRLALAVIERAERSGALKPGQTVIEATSGNTGIGLAMVCAAKGYPLVIVMAENFSIERRRLMRFLGAKVVLTPAAQKGSGMLAKAVELAETHGWYLTRQFENEANAEIHSATTAQEILSDFEGERLDFWVTTFGTGGTLNGVARALRQVRPETRIVVAEPENSAMLSSGIPQPEGDGSVSHPRFRPHPIQGTSPDFISKLAADAIADGLIDQVVAVNGANALRLSRELAQREGVFSGISAGASVAAGLEIAKNNPGATIVCMLPDTGERYLSTVLFDDVPVEMTAEETDIARSTPLCQFGAAPALSTPPPPSRPDEEAKAFVANALADADNPVVMFALEWCEFSWAARKLLAAMNAPFRSVDLDSVAFRRDDLGGRIRIALRERTGLTTIPQIFVGGEFIGGCSELFDAARSGDLARKLHRVGIRVTTQPIELDSFLPKWVKRKAS